MGGSSACGTAGAGLSSRLRSSRRPRPVPSVYSDVEIVMVRARYVLVVVLLASCASAQLTAFRDPAYTNTEYDRVAVFALGMTLQSTVRVEQSLCEKLSVVRCVAGTSVLPPTRVYSPAEITSALARAGADAKASDTMRAE